MKDDKELIRKIIDGELRGAVKRKGNLLAEEINEEEEA